MIATLRKLNAPAVLIHPEAGTNGSSYMDDNNTPISDKRCGTFAGFRAHQTRKEPICDLCAEAGKAYRKNYYAKNQETLKAQKSKWRENNPDRDKEIYKKWYENHSDKKRLQAQEWYEKNYDVAQSNKKKWASQNIEKVRQMGASTARRRRAKKKQNGVEKYTVEQVLMLYGTNCHICQKPIDFNVSKVAGIGDNWQNGLHIDHVVAIVNGGSDTLDNVRPSHALCNLKKGAK